MGLRVLTPEEIKTLGISVWVGEHDITEHVLGLGMESSSAYVLKIDDVRPLDWTDEDNSRRIDLIEKKLRGAADTAELIELGQLTQRLRDAQHAVLHGIPLASDPRRTQPLHGQAPSPEGAGD